MPLSAALSSPRPPPPAAPLKFTHLIKAPGFPYTPGTAALCVCSGFYLGPGTTSGGGGGGGVGSWERAPGPHTPREAPSLTHKAVCHCRPAGHTPFSLNIPGHPVTSILSILPTLPGQHSSTGARWGGQRPSSSGTSSGHGDLLHAWSPSRTFCKCLLNIYYTPSPGGRGGEEGPQPHSPLPWSWHSCCGNRWQTQALRVRGCSVLQGAEIRQGRKTGSAGGRFTPMGLAEVPLQVAQEWRARLASPSTHSESHTQEGKARRGTETHTGSLSSWL